jgi:bacterioferritin-associated ferredoxin
MYLCLCFGVTDRDVAEAVKAGAATTKQVAKMSCAGSECGRCRRTVRLIIEAAKTAPKLVEHTLVEGGGDS